MLRFALISTVVLGIVMGVVGLGWLTDGGSADFDPDTTPGNAQHTELGLYQGGKSHRASSGRPPIIAKGNGPAIGNQAPEAVPFQHLSYLDSYEQASQRHAAVAFGFKGSPNGPSEEEVKSIMAQVEPLNLSY